MTTMEKAIHEQVKRIQKMAASQKERFLTIYFPQKVIAAEHIPCVVSGSHDTMEWRKDI